MSFHLIVLICLYSTAFLGGIYGLTQFKNLRLSFKWITVFLLFSGLVQAGALMIGTFYGTNRLYNNLTIPCFYLLSYLIFANLSKDKRTLAINNILFIVGAVFLFFFMAIDINLGIMSKKAISVGNLVFSLASFLFFFELIKKPLRKSPLQMPKFYFLFSFLFYHSSVIFIWAAKAMFENDTNQYSIQYLHVATLTAYYCILTASLVVESKNNRGYGS